MMNFLFGGEKAPPPVDKDTALKEKVKGWQKELRKSMTRLEHDRSKNERDMATMKANASKLIAAGRADNAKMDIKNMLRLQQHNDRLGETRATLNSLSMQLGEQRAMLTVVGTLGKGSEILKCMNRITQLGGANDVVESLQREMITAGVLGEQVDAAMADINPVASEDVDKEVEAVYFKLFAESNKGAQGPVAAPGMGVAQTQQQQQQQQQLQFQQAMAMGMGGGGGGGMMFHPGGGGGGGGGGPPTQ